MKAFDVIQAEAKVFDDGMLGVKTATSLPPGEYEAVLVLRAVPSPTVLPSGRGPIEPMEAFLDRMKREHVRLALDRTNGNRTQAAKVLGLDVRTIFRLIEDAEQK